MQITIHYLAQIKRFAGCASEPMELLDGITLRDALSALGQRHGNAFRSLLLDEASEPRRSLLFFVGDDHADLARPLKDGDTVTILAPMAGGSDIQFPHD